MTKQAILGEIYELNGKIVTVDSAPFLDHALEGVSVEVIDTPFTKRLTVLRQELKEMVRC